MKRRLLLTIALPAAVFACIVLGSAIWGRFAANSQTTQLSGGGAQATMSEPPVALIDQDDRSFRFTDERGKEVVLLFGYAHCPDICPATLAKLARADRLLGSASRNVAVDFITVDPQRDTSATLKRFVDLFDAHFSGLTGSAAALDQVYAAYHVWHQRLPNHGSAAGYLMAHSSSIYLLDRDGNLRGIHDWTDSAAMLAHDMKALLP